MATPAAERRYRVLILDRAPEQAGTLELPALGGDAREEADTEYRPARASSSSASSRESRARISASSTRPALSARRRAPPASRSPTRRDRLPHGTPTSRASAALWAIRSNALRVVAGIARDRAERADRLRQPPAIAGPLVDWPGSPRRVRAHARAPSAASPERPAVEEHGATVLVSELLEEGEALLAQALGRLGVAGDVGRAPVRTQGRGANLGRHSFGLGLFEQSREPANCLRRVVRDPEPFRARIASWSPSPTRSAAERPGEGSRGSCPARQSRCHGASAFRQRAGRR